MEIKLKTTKKLILSKPILICGMPGSGYVGKIAIDYLIKQFNAKQICQIESNLLPSQVIIKNDGTSENIKYRIFKLENKKNKKDLLILTGESQPITSESNYLISEKIIEYVNKLGVKEVYTLAAYITGTFVKQPKVFGTATHINQIKQMKKNGIIIMNEGIITGMNGVLIGIAKIHGMKGISLLGETSGYVFDHNSSKAVLQSLSKLLKIDINTEYLDVEAKDQKIQYLVPLAKGDKIGAHAMTEPGAGSDVAGITTTAVKDGDSWIINGTKTFCTNGDIADIFLIFARTSAIQDKRHLGLSAFIIERNTDGFTIGNPISKTGIRGSKSVELILEDVKIPDSDILGEEGKGFYVAMDCYDHGRIEIAAQGVGIAQAAIESAAKYITQRIAFGKPIMEFQGPQFLLAEASSELQASRLLTYWAASLRDQDKDFVSAACMAKMYATEAAERAALTAIKLGGSAGVATEYPMERYLRDIQVTKIYEGTNDIQRVTLGRLLYKETKNELGLT